jgi:hypothetical protein
MADNQDLLVIADLPNTLTGLRACLRCSLIKEYGQFYDQGCENCEALQLGGNRAMIDSVSAMQAHYSQCAMLRPVHPMLTLRVKMIL